MQIHVSIYILMFQNIFQKTTHRMFDNRSPILMDDSTAEAYINSLAHAGRYQSITLIIYAIKCSLFVHATLYILAFDPTEINIEGN